MCIRDRLAPIPPLDPKLMQLMTFASTYYIQSLGETLIPSIPQYWKKPKNWPKQGLALLQKTAINPGEATEQTPTNSKSATGKGAILAAALNTEQADALIKLNSPKEVSERGGVRATLLQGRTGSGKTAVFLNWLANICLLYTSPSPRDRQKSRMPSSA